ncbi:hypothetical protein GCM10009798_34530 [Nocardioides panacihumi]|uniref:Uncharacterized protein n=1 Tax=Nocardioides panacihumi TaxID=400774 RepID=A0ABP5CXY9_9ACTN
MTRVVLVPGCLALHPRYASRVDPVADLRAACQEAVSWLGQTPEIVAGTQGQDIARALLETRTSVADHGAERSFLVVANGSACRTEKAPGYLDPRAEAFDKELGAALRGPDPEAIRAIDPVTAGELWADTTGLPALADLLEGARTVDIGYEDAPYGVQYWVARWSTP